MFLSLMQQECKMWLKSIIFYAYVIILFLFYVSQMGQETIPQKPQENQSDYGMTSSEDQTVIMNETLRSLLDEYNQGHYATYPIGFYKEVTLSESETQSMEAVITKLTGKEKKQWREELSDYYAGYSSELAENGELVVKESVSWNLVVSSDMTYDKFETIMEKVVSVIGLGSDYSKANLKMHGQVKKTYEQALTEYEDILNKDHVTGAYARLFCDYIGIMLGILPAFFGVARVGKDKRDQIKNVVYSKKANALIIVLSRYVGILIMTFVPVLFVSCFALLQSVYIANVIGASPDYFAYIKYGIGWLLPTIFFVSSVSYFIAELTESIFGIFINVALWFIFLLVGTAASLRGVGWNMIPRFNTVGEYQLFQELFPQLIRNRVLYIGISIILVGITVVVYKIKREGGIKRYGTIPKDINR